MLLVKLMHNIGKNKCNEVYYNERKQASCQLILEYIVIVCCCMFILN